MSRILILEEKDIEYSLGLRGEGLSEDTIILRVPQPYAPITHPMFGGNKSVSYLRVLQHILFDQESFDAVYSRVFLDKEILNQEYHERYGELLIDENTGKRGLFQKRTR